MFKESLLCFGGFSLSCTVVCYIGFSACGSTKAKIPVLPPEGVSLPLPETPLFYSLTLLLKKVASLSNTVASVGKHSNTLYVIG